MAVTILFSRKSRGNLALALDRGYWRDALIPYQLCLKDSIKRFCSSLFFALFVMVRSKPQESKENSVSMLGKCRYLR
jgi:hypothetical protein